MKPLRLGLRALVTAAVWLGVAAALRLGVQTWAASVPAELVVTLPPGLSATERALQVDEDLLVASARAAGWHRSDPIVRRRLLELAGSSPDADDADQALRQAYALGLDVLDPLARARLRDRAERALSAAPQPSDEDLEGFLRAHADRFRRDPGVQVEHALFTSARHADPAAAARAALASGAPVGDPVAGLRPRATTTPAALGVAWGPAVEVLVAEGAVGVWLGPVDSAHGAHLLRVASRSPARVPALHEIRAEVAEAWAADTRASRLRARLDGLAARARIVEAAP